VEGSTCAKHFLEILEIIKDDILKHLGWDNDEL
jgi:hypothetical protein